MQIQRGGQGEVLLQFTIPFISRHLISKRGEIQTPLKISIGTHEGSLGCSNSQNPCSLEIPAYKIQEKDMYDTEKWKAIHKIPIYNKHDGDYALIDRHVTLRFKTVFGGGNGSEIFNNITLSDIQVNICKFP